MMNEPPAGRDLIALDAEVGAASERPARTPPTVPDHDLLKRIGVGSYGEVWLARNAVSTPRAVKVVRRATFERAEHFEREFRGLQKFEPVSRAHAGLVDILQLGRNDAEGYFYYVMELADDSNEESEVQNAESFSPRPDPILHSSLPAPDSYSPRTLRSEQQRRTCLPVSDCVNIGVTLASALAHLHRHGLVHRDVKPSNIIFVDGVPKLADIGLVAEANEARSFVGTIGFIPPEGPGSPQADLYSLGKVLYEISTGNDRQDFPQLPPELLRGDRASPAHGCSRPSDWTGAGGDGDSDAWSIIELNEVLLRACHKDIRQRYASADAMQADLQRLQRGQSVLDKRARERRLAAATKALIGAGTLVLVVWAGILLRTPSPLNTANGSRAQSLGTTNAEAEREYQLGRFFFNKLTRESTIKAMDHFGEAIRLDTNFVAAYAGLADCHIWNPPSGYNQALPQIRALADRLLLLDPSRPEGHTALAIHLWWAERKPSDAERELRQAIQLNGQYGAAHHYYGGLLTSLGRFDQALPFLQRSVELQPTAVNFRLGLGHVYLARGEWERAIVEFEKARELEPETVAAHAWLAIAFEGKGDFLEALPHWQQIDLLIGRNRDETSRAYESARKEAEQLGAAGYWRARLEMLLAQKQPVLLHVATAHARLGHTQQALAWLERAAEETPADFGLLRLIFAPAWEHMRNEPRFKELLRKVGIEK